MINTREGATGCSGSRRPSVRADCGVCVGPDGWTRLAWATGGRITRGSGWLDETGLGHRRSNHAWARMAGRDWPEPPAVESRVGPDGWTRLAWATSGRITRGPGWLDETGLGHRRTNHAWLRMAGRDWPGPPADESRVAPDGWTRLAWATGGRITRGSGWLGETGLGHQVVEVTKWSNFRKKQRDLLLLAGRCIQVQNGDWSGSPSGRRVGRWTVVTLIGGVVWEGGGRWPGRMIPCAMSVSSRDRA